MTEEKERMAEIIKTFLNSLYNLSFANPLVIAISQLEGKHVLQAEEAYPEIFDNRSVRPFFSLFLSGDDKGFLKLTSLGSDLKKIRDHIHNFLNNEDLVARINESLRIELSNPIKDYVYTVLEQLDEKEKLCLRIASTTTSSISSVKEANSYLEPYGLQIEEEEFKEIIRKFNELMLNPGDPYYREKIYLREIFKPYIKEKTTELEARRQR